MSALRKTFSYPPLPVGEDAIRILTIEPGDFYEPLVCNLRSAAFSAKPRYVALSYTWGYPYADTATIPTSPTEVKVLHQAQSAAANPPKRRPHASSGDHGYSATEVHPFDLSPLFARNRSRIPTRLLKFDDSAAVTVNGCPFAVGRNLYLAILHLRSPTHPLPLWIDAVCINQADAPERNAQVANMYFIYSRAIKVVAWLGTKEQRNQLDLFRCLSTEWKSGQTQHFAASLGGSSRNRMRNSAEPDPRTFSRITESTYWTRLWIVQEVCIARSLVFVYGSSVWTYEAFCQWNILRTHISAFELAAKDVEDEGFAAMLQLINTRNEKYTDAVTLERLIERFATSECTELRDRVYGVLGLANDIRPFGSADGSVDPTAEYLKTLDLQLDTLPEPQRGMGALKVDYDRPFYDIWMDVMKFIYFRAKNDERRRTKLAAALVDGVQEENHIFAHERRISVVRTAGTIQQALGHAVERDITILDVGTQLEDRPIIRATGYISGEIVQLGPKYEALISSFQALQDWLACWDVHYAKAADMEALRRINDQYMAKIMSYGSEELGRIRPIPSLTSLATRVGSCRRPQTTDSRYVAAHEKLWYSIAERQSDGPGICIGTGYLIGLVPAAAKVGDVIVRFWGCDAAIVMRPIGFDTSSEDGIAEPMRSFMLVGRADVAEVVDRRNSPGRDSHAEQCLLGSPVPGFERGAQAAGAVYVDMNFRTLQVISASIMT